MYYDKKIFKEPKTGESMTHQDVKELEVLGLTKNDRRVYLAMIELGTVTVSELVKRTGLYRSYVYDVLDKLAEMGLVSYTIRNGKKNFNAENPERILQAIDAEKQELEEKKSKLKEVIREEIKEKFGGVLDRGEGRNERI